MNTNATSHGMDDNEQKQLERILKLDSEMRCVDFTLSVIRALIKDIAEDLHIEDLKGEINHALEKAYPDGGGNMPKDTNNTAGSDCPAASCSALDAGSVVAGPDRYTVTHTHDHKTLKLGDVVVMGETPRMDNVLIRVEDMTVHGLCGASDQYVHLEPNDQGLPPAANNQTGLDT